ncbi:Stealth protein CR1, conserved region 1 [Microlunatus sagamiharensis]|uniref:Stealth protein CR1, conserved region 1 n=1 Tax=Microlunatus sagamiharensis TaxID=546874 RepID=A0A1H2N8L9_9ACTN|nr:Stealth protein CR1, conserved region 1 [Microlunatus sagamiharensis]
MVDDPAWQPQQLRDDNLERTASALELAGVPYALLRTSSATRHAVAVAESDRTRTVEALSASPRLRTARVQEVAGTRAVGRSVPAPALGAARWRRATVLRVFRRVRARPGSYTVGELYGCDVELWEEGPTTGVNEVMALAPRPNVASDVLPRDVLRDTEPVTVGGRDYPRPRLFARRMLEDLNFDVDVVCTWVDGDDPAWRERMLRARARAEGTAFHAESVASNRFASRDELRYALRSLHSYAPWVRHVWLVTDDQRPAWLTDDTPGLTVVDHRDIVDDHSVLPLFNSNAIISRLHHIDGLAEHYLYLNDDMFFGQDVRPQAFFHPSGVARLFPARLHRPFGAAGPGDEPHINLSRNIRALLEERFGTTATHAIRHTPYPQLRSRQRELEALFPEAYARVLHHPFRHHEDIAPDQLLHYYLQVVGAGVPSSISYDYVNVGVAEQQHRLRRLLLGRDRSVFCLNDAPVAGEPPVPDAVVRAFLESYFPVPSPWEVDVRRPAASAAEPGDL